MSHRIFHYFHLVKWLSTIAGLDQDWTHWTGLVDWNDKLGLEGARGAQNVCSVGLPESSAIYIAGL